jgi:hypothetical protein
VCVEESFREVENESSAPLKGLSSRVFSGALLRQWRSSTWGRQPIFETKDGLWKDGFSERVQNGYTGLFDVNLSSGQQAEGSFPRDDFFFSANSENL